MEKSLNRIKGCMFGQAIGDALGLGTEFMTKDEVRKTYPCGLTDYDQIVQDYHRSHWHKGDWTDDTDMWLCIARAIINNDGILNCKAIAQEFKNWHNGTPLGCGGHTNKVLSMGDYVENPYECSKLWLELNKKYAAGNGALMRTSIIGLLPNYEPWFAENVCQLTHFDTRCIGSCVVFCNLLNSLVYEKPLPSVDDLCAIANGYDDRIADFIRQAYRGPLDSVIFDDYTMGYTLNTLFVAFWAYYHAASFESGLLEVVNAGGDADTNAAVTCSLLGAKFGFDSIPSKYVEGLYRNSLMQQTYRDFRRLLLDNLVRLKIMKD